MRSPSTTCSPARRSPTCQGPRARHRPARPRADGVLLPPRRHRRPQRVPRDRHRVRAVGRRHAAALRRPPCTSSARPGSATTPRPDVAKVDTYCVAHHVVEARRRRPPDRHGARASATSTASSAEMGDRGSIAARVCAFDWSSTVDVRSCARIPVREHVDAGRPRPHRHHVRQLRLLSEDRPCTDRIPRPASARGAAPRRRRPALRRDRRRQQAQGDPRRREGRALDRREHLPGRVRGAEAPSHRAGVGLHHLRARGSTRSTTT